MILDPDFRNSVPLQKSGSAVQATENWFVELKRAASGANPQIRHGNNGGLELQWDAPVGRARVWQELDPQVMNATGAPLDFNASVTLIGGVPTTAEWIAILEEIGGQAQFHAQFKLSTTRIQNGVIVFGKASNVRLEPGHKYRFCIQFTDAPINMTLQSVVLEVLERAPPTQAAKRAFSDSALLVKQLQCTLDFEGDRINAGAIEEVLRTMFERNDRRSLLGLMELVGGIDPSVGRVHPLRSKVVHYYARMMLQANASETGYVHLRALLANPSLAAALSDLEIREIRKRLARACVRTGRIDEARQIQLSLLQEKPSDWEPYYHLGILQSEKGAQVRRLYHDTAETLANSMSSIKLSLIAELYINEGAPDEALKRALRRLRELRKSKQQEGDDEKELYLTLANAWLATGETGLWLAHLQRYFESFNLTGPDIESADRRQHILHMRDTHRETRREGPLVTIVMTSFNASATIEHAARSVLNQTHGNLRLVIVDDCSEDDTRRVIERLAVEDDRIATMFNDRNMGTYCSKNRALRQFESDFYTFHDSDDWMHPERLSTHLAATRDHVRFTTSMWLRVDESGRAIVRDLGGYLHVNPASTFFGADVLESVGFFDSVRSGADSEFVWRARHILGEDAVARIQRPLALGLNRDGSLTMSGPTAFDEYRYSPVRVDYWESWAAWHNSIVLRSAQSEMFIPYPLDERKFEAPAEILPDLEPLPPP